MLGIREGDDACRVKPITDVRRIELLKILAECCQKHHDCRAKWQVKIDCEPCSVMWEARLELEAVE